MIYEVVWTRMFVLVIGNTIFSTGIVLAVFMCGLALGGYFWGLFIDRSEGSANILFGILDIAIAIYGFLFPVIFKFAPNLEIFLYGLSTSGRLSQITSGLTISLLFILPPTFLMGGTFSAIGSYTIRSRNQFASKAALLYGVNTAGAILGAFITCFFLIRLLGHNKTLMFAAIANLITGLCALMLKKEPPDNNSELKTSVKLNKRSQKISEQKKYSEIKLSLFYGVFVSGFCSLALQAIWSRILLLVADNSIYSFTAVLILFLSGIALGSLLLPLILEKIDNKSILFGLILICISLSSFFVPFFMRIDSVQGATPYWRFLISHLPFFMLVPTSLMGAALPLASHIYHETGEKTASSIGIITALNTAGAVAGSLSAAFWMIPALGVRNSLILLSLLYLSSGALIILSSIRYANLHILLTGLTVAVLITASYYLMPPDYFQLKYGKLEPQSTVVYYNEGSAATVSVLQRQNGHRALYVNGIPEIDTTYLSIRTLKLLGVLSGLLSEKHENALMVTFGGGVTASAASLFADKVDCVDLIEPIKPVAGYFTSVNDNIADNQDVTFHEDDARHYLQSENRKYSFIISDASHPRSYDSWILYTQEFYELAKSRLQDRGLFCQWLPFHGMDEKQFLSIIRTFSSVFQNSSLWCVDDGYIIMIATPEPLKIDFNHFSQELGKVRQSLRGLILDNPSSIISTFVMSADNIRKMTSGAAVIHDNSPVNLFFPFDATFEEQYNTWPLKNIDLIRKFEEPASRYIGS